VIIEEAAQLVKANSIQGNKAGPGTTTVNKDFVIPEVLA